MPFATGDGNLISLDLVYENIETRARGIKSRAQRVRDTSAGGNLTGRDVVLYFNQLGEDLDAINGWVSGVDTAAANTYAIERYNDATYVASTEFVAMRTEVDSVLSWMSVNVPVGNIVAEFNITTRRVDYTTFSVGQTAGFRTVLDALIASID